MANNDKSDFGNVVNAGDTAIDAYRAFIKTLTAGQVIVVKYATVPLKFIGAHQDYQDFKNAGFSPAKSRFRWFR